MPAGGDVIELVHEQESFGQQVNNVYYFEAAVVDASMSALATWFETNVVVPLKTAQTDQVSHVNLRLRNLFNLAETYEEPLSGTGGVGSGFVELPPFISGQIRLDHATGNIRPGFKRFAGLSEDAVVDGMLAGGWLTNYALVGDQLVNPPATANPDWAHVIVKRVCEELNPVIGAIPLCLKYKLPESQVEKDVAYPISYEVYTQITSQNSRKWYT